MLKSFAALSVTTGVRLLTGLVLFVLIARDWTAHEFGQFMYLFSVAALLVLLCEFGFMQQIMREVARNPAKSQTLIGTYLSAKVWLALASALLCVLFSVATKLSVKESLTLALLLLSAIAMSFADFFMAALRAVGKFGHEARISTAGNLLYFALAIITLYKNGDSLYVAFSFSVARSIQLILSYQTYKAELGKPINFSMSLPAALKTAKNSAAYGADVAIGAAFSNVDTILIAHTLGNEAVGIYQAVARFFLGACLLPPIFGGVFLPRLSSNLNNPELFKRDYRTLSIGLGASGAIAGLFFAFGRDPYMAIYKNSNLVSGEILLPWFAALLVIRYMASIHGTVLTALGNQRERAWIYLASFLITITASPILINTFGLPGMIIGYIISYSFLAIGFWHQINREFIRPPYTAISILYVMLIFGLSTWKLNSAP